MNGLFFDIQCNLCLSIDVLCLSLNQKKHQLLKELKSNPNIKFQKMDDLTKKKNNKHNSNGFKVCYEFKINNRKINFYFSDDPKKRASLFLYQPTYEIQKLISSILTKLDIDSTFSKLELPFDFTPQNPEDLDILKRKITQHEFRPYHYGNSFDYKETFYTGDLRKGSGGLRNYKTKAKNKECPEVDKMFWRSEYVLYRKKIKAINITFPITSEMLQAIDINQKLFKFVRFDHKAFKSYITRNEDRINALCKKTGMDLKASFRYLKGKRILVIVETIRRLGFPIHDFLIPYQNENEMIKKAVDEMCFDC